MIRSETFTDNVDIHQIAIAIQYRVRNDTSVFTNIVGDASRETTTRQTEIKYVAFRFGNATNRNYAMRMFVPQHSYANHCISHLTKLQHPGPCRRYELNRQVTLQQYAPPVRSNSTLQQYAPTVRSNRRSNCTLTTISHSFTMQYTKR